MAQGEDYYGTVAGGRGHGEGEGKGEGWGRMERAADNRTACSGLLSELLHTESIS